MTGNDRFAKFGGVGSLTVKYGICLKAVTLMLVGGEPNGVTAAEDFTSSILTIAGAIIMAITCKCAPALIYIHHVYQQPN